MAGKKKPSVYIIAGPNGAGKTTFATEFLPLYAKCKHFVNADLIAKGLEPFAPEKAAIHAGRILLEQLRTLADQNADFAFETTLSGKTHANFIKELKNKGYSIHLFYLWIPAVELSLLRIKERVQQGGHNVPAKDVRRRFKKSLDNFWNVYRPMADYWHAVDGSNTPPPLIAKGAQDKIAIVEKTRFDLMAEDIQRCESQS